MSTRESGVPLAPKNIPLSVYDIFGYFIPAITGFSLCLIFEIWGSTLPARGHVIPRVLARMQQIYDPSIIEEFRFRCFMLPLSKALAPPDLDNWLTKTLLLVSIISILYAFGHVIAAFSSFFIDRLLMFRGTGYPYESLLDIRNTRTLRITPTRQCIQAIFVASMILLLISYIRFFFDVSFLFKLTSEHLFLNADLTALHLFFRCLAICTSCVAVALLMLNIMLLFIEFTFVFVLRPQKEGLSSPRLAVIIRYVSFPRLLLLIPLLIVQRRNSFSKDFRKLYKSEFKSAFNLDSIKEDTNNYWLPETYICDRAPQLYARLVNWLHMYSFARNLATALFGVFIYTSVVLLRNEALLANPNLPQGDLVFLKTLPLLYFLFALAMLYAYYHLYAGYYTKYIYRGFVYLRMQHPLQPHPDLSSPCQPH